MPNQPPKLWEHQRQTLAFSYDHPLVFDTSSAGTGKTAAWARSMQHRLEADCSRVVVLCPKSLMYSAWGEDLELFTPDLTISYAEAPEDNRMKALREDTNVLVVNSDAVRWMAKLGKRELKRHLGRKPMMLVDESALFKNPAASRTKALIYLSNLFEYRTAMSGTAAPTSVTELWSQVRVVDGGARLGTRYQLFRSLMQESVNINGFKVWTDVPEARVLTHAMIRSITIGHKFSKVMKNVPDMEKRKVYYHLTDKHRAL